MVSSRLLFFILLCGIAVITSCAGKAAPDIVNYVNQGLIPIAQLEQKSLEDYASVTGDNYSSERQVYEALKNNVIPIYKRFVEGLRQISPENNDIRKVHGMYIRSAELIYDGFKAKLTGIENNDGRIVQQGNEKIEQGCIGIEKWSTELNELYKKHGVAEMKGK